MLCGTVRLTHCCLCAMLYVHIFAVSKGVALTTCHWPSLLQEQSLSEKLPGVRCYGCLSDLSTSDKEDQERGVVLQCSDCKQHFCFDCDLYVHESLHNCPGCEASTIRHHDADDNDMMSPD